MIRNLFNRKARPYKGKIETSEMVTEGTITSRFTGLSRSVSATVHFVASSQKKIDPQKGPESVLWDIIACGQTGSGWYTDSKAHELNLTYKEMCEEMLCLEKEAAGRGNQPSKEFIEERRPLVSKKNILNFIKP